MAHVDQLHPGAILALLAAAPPASPVLVVYDGLVPMPPAVPAPPDPPYLLAYFSTTRPDGTSLRMDSDRAVTRAFLHCVGADASAARAVAGRAAAALLDVTPTIAGRECFPIRDDNSGGPPQRDETTGVPVMDQVVVYVLESVPA